MCCESQSAAPEPKETEFSKTLAEIMRERQSNARKFQPLEDQLIGSVQQFQTPDFQQGEAAKALGDVTSSMAQERARSDAELQSMGVNPNSGAYADRNLKLGLGGALGRAGAFGTSRDRTRRLAFDTLAGVSGRGDAKVGMAIDAASRGGSLYNDAQRNQMQWQQGADDMSGIGSLIGTAGSLMFLSSKDAKKNVTPVKGALKQVRKMPAKNWTYKGDTARHVGPMAEDHQKATGRGDGRRLSLPDLQGVTLAAVQELDRDVQALKKRKG